MLFGRKAFGSGPAASAFNDFFTAWFSAAFDLQSRVYNILFGFEVSRRPGSSGFLQAFLLDGTEQQANYVRSSTAFVFAQYLGWVEIFREDLQFLDLGDSKTNRQTLRRGNQPRHKTA